MKSGLLDFFERDNSSLYRFLHDIVCLLEEYELMIPSYLKSKSIVNSRLLRMRDSQFEAGSLGVLNVKFML